jgi:hypothetical protein
MHKCSQLQQTSAAEIARAWVEAHPLVNYLLYLASLVVLCVVIVGGVCVIFYGAWFLLRLLKPKNVARFLKQGIPTRVRGTLAGAGLEIGEEVAQVLPEFERTATETLAQLEARISKVENQLNSWEDTEGRL